MTTPATVVSLVGQAWALTATGTRRELKVGDRLNGDERLIVAPGAQLDLDFGDNRQLSFIGEQQIVLDETATLARVPERETLSPEPQAPRNPGEPQQGRQDGETSAPDAPTGHRFVELVRIGEILEADGITPLTVARIQEVLRPLGMTLPERAFERDWRYEHRGDGRHETGSASRTPGVRVELQGAGEDGAYNAAEIGPDGTVTAIVTLDEHVREGDRLVVKDGNGKVLLDRPVTAEDLRLGAPVEVPAAPGQTTVIVEAIVTTPNGFSGASTDNKPVDNDVPGVSVELQDAGADGVYNQAEIGPDGTVPALVTLDDKVKVGDTLVVTDKNGNVLLERPVTQNDLANGVLVDVPVAPGDTEVPVTATITDPAGNSSSDSDNKPVDNDVPGVSVELQDAGADGVYNQAEIGPGGTVPALVTLDDKVKVGDTLVVTDKNGNVLLERPVTQNDLANGVLVDVPVAPGDTEVPVTATITDPAGNSSSDSDNKPVDNLPPVVTPIADRHDVDSDQIALDTSSYFTDALDGRDLAWSATGLPAGLSIDPGTGVISGTIDHSASQRDSDGDGQPDGNYGVTITVTDKAGNSAETSFNWSVGNPPPIAVNDSNTTEEDSALHVDAANGVLANDSDPDGDDQLSVTGFAVDGQSYHAGDTAVIAGVGELTLNADGSYSFVPVANWNGNVPAVIYAVSDGEGGIDTAELNIVVTPVNDAPVALPPASPLDQISLDADSVTTVTLDLPNLFDDVDGDTLIYTIAGLPDGLSFDPATGRITGTIDSSASQGGPDGDGSYRVVLSATDSSGVSATQSFNWTVSNPPPVANDDTASTLEGTPISGNVLANGGNGDAADSDPDGDALVVTTFVIGNEPTVHPAGSTVNISGIGSLALNADGSYTFTPLPGWNGTVPPVAYTISDNEGGSATAQLTINVTPVDDPVIVVVPTDHTAGTPDGNKADQVVFESGLANGSSPNADDTAVEASFTIDALDGLSSVTIGYTDASGNQTLTLSRTEVEALGDHPQTITTRYGTLELNGYSRDPATGKITVEYQYNLVNAPEVSGSQTDDSFAVTVNDSDDDSHSQNLVIRIVDDAPVADNDVNSVTEDTTEPVTGQLIEGASGNEGKDTEGADGATVSKIVAGTDNSQPGIEPTAAGVSVTGQYGTLTLHTDGSYSYQLDNANLAVQGLSAGESLDEVFTYTLTDKDGDADTATLTITVSGNNDGVTVTVPTNHDATTPDGVNADQVVFESGLSDGSNPSPDNAVVNASFTVSALDGLDDSAAVTLDYIDASGAPASLTLSKAQVEALGSVSQTVTTRYGTLELNGYSLGGDGVITLDYSYALVNAPEVSGDHTSDTFGITAADRDGDDHSQNLIIRIVDDAPQASADTDGVAAGQYSAETGNVITGVGTTNTGDSGLDAQGADGAGITGISSRNMAGNTATSVDGTLTIQGQYGTLVIAPNGDYSYTRALDTPGGVNDVFTYTLTDADGDDDTATLTITIAGGTPEITGLTPQATGGELTFEEKYLSDGSTPDASQLTKTGEFTISSPDGVKSLTIAGITVIENGVLTSTTTLTTALGNSLAIVGYDPATGVVQYSYTLGDNEHHTKPGNDTSLFENINLVLTDHDDQTASGTLSVQINDDQPVILANATQVGSVTVDETSLGTSATDANFVQNAFAIDYGADGDASLVYALNVSGAGVPAGVIDTASGQGIYLYQEGNAIVGRIGSSGAADPSGVEALRISIDATTGAVTLTQTRPLKHSDTDDHDDVLTLASGAITLTATATDGDGDVTTSTAVEVGDRFGFKDDGPAINAAPAGVTLDEAHLANGSDPASAPLAASQSLNVRFGNDGAGDVQFTEATMTALQELGLKSGGQSLSYTIADGHTLTASANGQTVFTVVITNPTTTPGYRFTLNRPLDHLGAGNPVDHLDLGFEGIRVTDKDGDSVSTEFTVTVLDDAPDESQPKSVTVTEDSTALTPGNTFNTNADATGSNTTIVGGNKPLYGTATVNPDGTITYVPDANYSGTDTFTYTTVTDNETKTFTIEVTVNPVADAPDMDGTGPSTGGNVTLADISTLEDTAVALGLKAPIITDGIDQNVAAAGDAAERLGAITLELTGAQVNGVKLTASADDLSGAVDITYSGPVTIWLTDAPHPADMTPPAGAVLMTSAQFEALQLLPVAHRGDNIDVSVKAISYEVDDAGHIAEVNGTQVPGATSEATFKVWVQAVTDDAELVFDTGVVSGTNIDSVSYTGNTQATVTLKEDTTFRLNDILKAQFADLDGSEVRSITITNTTGQAILVNGTQLAVGGVRTINARSGANGQTGDLDSFPDIRIGAVGDFSGDLNGIIVGINAQDRDADGFQGTAGNVSNPPNGVAEADPSNNSVTLNLHITPVAGDVAAGNVSTDEDTAVAFLQHLRVTDTGTGTEVIDSVSFEVPANWLVTDSTVSNGATWTVNLADSTYTIEFTGGTQAEREAVLDGFMIRPPAHSSLDATIRLTVTTTDTNAVTNDTDTRTVTSLERPSLAVGITVRPVGERVDSDTDGQNGNDVTMNGNHAYTDAGAEDAWFALDSNGFDLKTPWTNEDGNGTANGGAAGDGSEQTFARFTPYSVDGSTDTLLDGSWFQYHDGTSLRTVAYNGTPVDIPIQYLDTVQFKGPSNFKGLVKIKVQAVTIDYDEDNPSVTNEQVSGEAWLSNLILEPVADQVTLKVDARITANEDSPISLNIRPTSDDPTETFNVTIKGIPAGASITYKGVTYTADNGLTADGNGNYQLQLENFDRNQQPKLTPPEDSNLPINLSVEAVSIDTLVYTDADGQTHTIVSEPGNPHTLPIAITLVGVPDTPEMTVDNGNIYAEDTLDSGSNQVELKDLITGLRSGETATDDTSETITLRISGLADGFTLVGAGPAVGNATGADRVWVVTPGQIADGSVKIQVPANYSGTVTFTAQPVVTESDNPSDTFFDPENVSFTVTPSPEATLTISSSVMEDLVRQVDLSPVYHNGDTDEQISAVRIQDVPGLRFYSDAAGTQPLVAVDGWYEITGVSQVKSIYVKGAPNVSGDVALNVQYKVIDTPRDGTVAAVESSWQNAGHTLNFQPVTDEVGLALESINGLADTSAYELTTAGTVTVRLNISKAPDSNAGGEHDYDGSERLTHILIQGVPEGVAVAGAVFTGDGQWLLPATDAFTGAITQNIVFSVSGHAGSLDNAPITITVVTRDGAATTTEQASITWNLSTDFVGGEPEKLPTVALSTIDAPQTEDGSFSLDQVMSGSVDTTGASSASFDMTVTLRTAPGDETSFPGMTRTEAVENGMPVVLWTTTVTGVTGDTAQALLESALAGITVTPPANANGNANNLGGGLPLNVTVTFHNNGVHSEGHVVSEVALQPVTDPAVVAITTAPVAEGEAIAISISVTNSADADGDWSVIGGALYLQLVGNAIPGQLSLGGTPLTLQTVTGIPGLADGQYYIVTSVEPDAPLNMIYTPSGKHDSGSLQLNAWVQNQENGSVAVVSTGNGALTIRPTNTQPEVVITVQGTEHDGVTRSQAQLQITGDVLPDSSETLQSAFIEGLPKDFTVFYGSDAASAVLAGNAGGSGATNTWSIPVSGNELPAYIAIQAPAHWSGTLENLKLYLVSGESGNSPTAWPVEFVLTVAPVADGIELRPTLSFGAAGEVIALNLNAEMKDPVAVSGSDGHRELTTLQLTGLPDGAKVMFYVGNAELDPTRVTFDANSGTHTISDLTQAELDGLGILQLGTDGVRSVEVKARTQEVDANGNPVGAASTDVTKTLQINVSDKLPTTSDDRLLWTGSAIDGRGGEDTIQLRYGESLSGGELASNLRNIEVLDLSAKGENAISGLSARDVLAITDDGNLLTIRGDAQDSVALSQDSGWNASSAADGYAVYTAVVDSATVTLRIENGVHVD